MKKRASRFAVLRSWRLGATLALHGGFLAAAGAVGWNVAAKSPPRPAEPFIFTVKAPAGRKAPDQPPAPAPMPRPTPPPPEPAPVPETPVTVARAEVATQRQPVADTATAPVKQRRPPPPPPKPRSQTTAGSGRSSGQRSQGGAGSRATAGDGDGGAVLVSSRPPRYPAAARAARREGTVTVRVTVDPAGRVVNSRLHRSCGSGDLDAAAVSAVHSWRFRPAHRGGRAITSDALVRVRFSLR